MSDNDAKYIKQVKTALKGIHPLLAGLPPQVQGAILADLFATWIGGHVGGQMVEQLRKEIIDEWMETAMKLVEIIDDERDAR